MAMLTTLASFAQAQSVKPFRSLTVGNVFVYRERGAGSFESRHTERVVRDTTIGGKRWAVVVSSIFGQGSSQRLERSDADNIYVYQNGREEIAHSFRLNVDDSVRAKLLHVDYGTIKVKNLVRSVFRATGDTLITFTSYWLPYTSFIYSQTIGFASIYTDAPSPSGNRRLDCVGSIIDGKVSGDTSLGRWGVMPVSVQPQARTAAAPLAAALRVVSPNPFSASVSLAYTVNRSATMTASVYSLDGLRVATLLAPTRQAQGDYRLEWNGNSSAGGVVAAGQYFVVLFANDQQIASVGVVKQ